MKRYWVYGLVMVTLLSACAAPSSTATSAPAATATIVVATEETIKIATSQPAATDTEAVPPTQAPTETEAPVPTASAEPGVFAPDDYTFEKVADGLDLPLLVTNAGDGSGRLFIVEQSGPIRIMQGGQVLPEPFLDLTALVTHGGNEQGLLGLAFPPDYAQSGQFYVDYTDVNGDTRMARYNVSAADANTANPDSAQILLAVDQPYPNHNGGNLAFGPDGYLYVGLGDGGAADDPHRNGQNKNTLLGKLLRLDVAGGGETYAIPPTNPFVGQANTREEIWAYGLRNPWRFNFDPASGDLYIADVGQDRYEEVDYQPAASKGGENYGWVIREGLHPNQGNPPAGAQFVDPVAEYAHATGGCSVTGGYVYRGAALPELNGVYFYGDYCSGIIWTLTHTGDKFVTTQFAESGLTISSFGEDEAGELYVCDLRAGVVYRLVRKQ
ncbi:MAG: PQQ-dependent sugar dehydrogenase [Anaerolineales bacterium]